MTEIEGSNGITEVDWQLLHDGNPSLHFTGLFRSDQLLEGGHLASENAHIGKWQGP